MNAELKITLTPSGQVLVTGPIANKLLCYGMLGLARDVVRDFDPQAAPAVEETTEAAMRRLLSEHLRAGPNGGG